MLSDIARRGSNNCVPFDTRSGIIQAELLTLKPGDWVTVTQAVSYLSRTYGSSADH